MTQSEAEWIGSLSLATVRCEGKSVNELLEDISTLLN